MRPYATFEEKRCRALLTGKEGWNADEVREQLNNGQPAPLTAARDTQRVRGQACGTVSRKLPAAPRSHAAPPESPCRPLPLPLLFTRRGYRFLYFVA